MSFRSYSSFSVLFLSWVSSPCALRVAIRFSRNSHAALCVDCSCSMSASISATWRSRSVIRACVIFSSSSPLPFRSAWRYRSSIACSLSLAEISFVSASSLPPFPLLNASISAFLSLNACSIRAFSASTSRASASIASSAAFSSAIFLLYALSAGHVPSRSTSLMMSDRSVIASIRTRCACVRLASTSGVSWRLAQSSSVVLRIASATLSDSSLFTAMA